MKLLILLLSLAVCLVAVNCRPSIYESSSPGGKLGSAVDEVVVGSSLHIKKPIVRRARDLSREKRQFHRRRPQFGLQQSAANAAANSNYFGPGGFGASAANAQAQGFQSRGPLGGFGASSAGTQTQSFGAGPNGIQGAAGASLSQQYRLPNGQNLNVNFAEGFSAGPGGLSGSNSNSIGFS